VRRLVLLLIALVLAACGGGSSATTLYAGGNWKVMLDGDKATAFHSVAGSWQPDTTGAVKIRILGPDGTVAPTPQVAAELSAKKPLIESGMWVDGKELVVKGGGLTATKGTIYGAPDVPLTKGTHVAVAYARTASHATAVAWSFRVA
jgi:ABC-type glycerol-3-phosphate transport system substrate-binding protein